MTKTDQPHLASRRLIALSRSLFPSNFRRQNATLVLGIRFPRVHLCRCQKHPCTKMTLRRLLKTRSGHPGRSRAYTPNLYPRERRSLRTRNSGLVSLARTKAIRSLRSSGVSGSVLMQISCPIMSRARRDVQCPSFQQRSQSCGGMRAAGISQ